jgi:hypothetical protein
MSTPALLAVAEALKNTATEIQSIGAKLHSMADVLEKEADVFLLFSLLFLVPPAPVASHLPFPTPLSTPIKADTKPHNRP